MSEAPPKIPDWQVWLFTRLPPCEEITAMASQSFDAPLGLRRRFQFHVHLAICFACRRYFRQQKRLRQALRGMPQDAELPEATRQRLQKRLDAAMKELNRLQ